MRRSDMPTEPEMNVGEYDPNNVFAKILRGEIPAHKVYEDADTLAFMDVMPQSTGHMLVVPKAASRNLFDADPAALGTVMAVVRKLALAARKGLDADGVQIAQFNEDTAGQTVFHLHFHVIPRYAGVPLKKHSGEMERPEILAANAEKIRAAL
jgi:histidine triad (HIT) family protein